MGNLVRQGALTNLSAGCVATLNLSRAELPAAAIVVMPIDIDKVDRIRLTCNGRTVIDFHSGVDEETGARISAGRMLDAHNQFNMTPGGGWSPARVRGGLADQLYIPLPGLVFQFQQQTLELTMDADADNAALTQVHTFVAV